MAEPKNTGVCLPPKNRSLSKLCDAPRTSSTSTRSSLATLPNSSSKRGLSKPCMVSEVPLSARGSKNEMVSVYKL